MKYRRFFVLALLGFVSSCTVYIPQTADIALIEKKNDLRLDAGMAAGFMAGTATVSYGLTKNVAIQVYGTTDFNDRYFFHGALGYYKKFTNDYVLELYGGVGNGKGYSSNHDTGDFRIGEYMEYFTQINYGKSGNTNSIWDYGFGLKAGYLHANINVEYGERNPGFPLADYSYKTDDFLLEPAMFTRIGGENLKLGLKITGLITPFSTGEYFPINASLTLNYRLRKY